MVDILELTEEDYRYVQRQLGLRYKVPLTDDEINEILREWDYSFRVDYERAKRGFMEDMAEAIARVFAVTFQELGLTIAYEQEDPKDDRSTPSYRADDPQEPGHPDSDLLPVPYRPG